MDDGSSPLPGIIIFVILILLGIVLQLYHAALEHINESNAEKEAENGNATYRYILRLVEDPSPLHAAIQVVTIVSGMIFGILVFRRFALGLYRLMPSVLYPAASWVISWVILILAFLILSISVGYLAPLKIGAHYAEKLAPALTGFVKVLITCTTPVTGFLNLTANGLIRLFGIDPHDYEDDVTEDEIIDLIEDAHEQGVIEESEAEMIQNVIEFGDKSARDIMTHRMNVNAIECTTTLTDAVTYMVENTNTRYPVYYETMDNIIGIIHLKDAAGLLLQQEYSDVPVCLIDGLIRNVGFIPETRRIDSIFKAMKAKKVHMTIVVDEYGQTAGLVTMEDILEEIVGSILDEYDDSDDFIQMQFDDSMLMEGLAPLDQVGEVLGLDLEDLEFETLNGWLTSILEHIPTEEDQTVETDGYCFQILGVENNTIQKVRVTKLQKEKGEQPCQDIQNSQT